MSRIDILIEQIVFARNYTLRLLDATPLQDWFRIPPAGVTHIAWQIGHLTMAQYRLGLERIRGHRPEDEALVSATFLAHFGRESAPNSDVSRYPSAEKIRTVFDAVNAQLMTELPTLPDNELDLPPLKLHSLVKTKIATLQWCSHHEMVHAGQIGLLRRQLGHDPVW